MWFIRLRKLGVFFVCFVLALAFHASDLSAQETKKISGKVTATYTNQDTIVVGDIIGHVLYLSTSEGKNVNTGKHTFMDNAQTVNMSYSDLIQGNGIHQGHIKFTKDSDTIYAKLDGKVTTVLTTEGLPATSMEGVFTYTKGTGKFENIKGNGTFKGEFISKKEYFVEWQAEYSIEK